MTPADFANTMAAIASMIDTEAAHLEADVLMANALRELGYGDGIAVFDGMKKWYS